MQSIKENGLILLGHIADALERKWIKGLASTSCTYSCEFCLIPGITVEHKVGILLPWPHVKPLPPNAYKREEACYNCEKNKAKSCKKRSL